MKRHTSEIPIGITKFLLQSNDYFLELNSHWRSTFTISLRHSEERGKIIRERCHPQKRPLYVPATRILTILN